MNQLNIPKNPSVNIDEYVHKLSSTLQIKISDDRIRNIVYKVGINEVVIGTDVSKRTIKRYLKQDMYPLVFFHKLNHLIAADIFSRIAKSDTLFVSKWKTVRLPVKATPTLAYFVGYLHGDGCIECNERKINFIDEYEEQMERIDAMCFKLFGINGKIKAEMSLLSKKPAYRLIIESKAINSYFHCAFNMNQGKKNILQIPEIFKRNKTLLRWYLSGLFDADGTLPKNPKASKQLFIDVTFKDKTFIEEIREALLTFGITTLSPYCRMAKSPSSDYISETWELRIRRKAEIIRFLKSVGFAHPDKERRAREILQLLDP